MKSANQRPCSESRRVRAPGRPTPLELQKLFMEHPDYAMPGKRRGKIPRTRGGEKSVAEMVRQLLRKRCVLKNNLATANVVKNLFTERELSVLEFLLNGITQCEIAAIFGISQPRVSKVQRMINKKMGNLIRLKHFLDSL